MNQFHITGKIIFINPMGKNNSHSMTIAHYPDDINDGYFDMGLVFPNDLWLKYDFKTYDLIEVKGHYVSLNKNIDPKKAKLVHVVDEVLEIKSENA